MNVTVIGVAGGSGSGKSTFTNRILTAFPGQIAFLCHDNYYRSRDGIPFEERTHINYDHPDALETELLISHLKMLKRGRSIQSPVYDYSQHNRSSETVTVDPKPVVIVEGILVLQNLALLNLLDIKIFVEADADERIIRRIIRDVQDRGRDIRGIADQYLTTVKPMHYVYVEPTKYQADIVINGGMNDIAFDLLSTKIKLLIQEEQKYDS